MKRFALLLAAAALACPLCLFASAKEVTVYENDFSSASALSDFTVRGKWSVSGGKARLAKGNSSSGCLIYKIPAEHAGKKYKVEVDFLGHTGMGGLLIGAEGKKLTETPSYFFGYTASTSAGGDKGLFAYFKEDGSWGGNLRSGLDKIDEADLHLTVVVNPADDTLTYTITSLDGERQFFAMTYTLQTVDNEKIYSRYSDLVGLRRAYASEGSFDNFRISVYEDDVMPTLGKNIEFSGLAFAASDGVTVKDGTASGGTLLSSADFGGAAEISAELLCRDRVLFYFGMRDEKNGFALEFNKVGETVVLYAIEDGHFRWLGERHVPIADGFCKARVSVRDSIVSVCYDCYGEGADAYPLLELKLIDAAAGRFGFLTGGGEVRNISLCGAKEAFAGETYTNPVAWGADPDVLFYDGVYYLYNRKVEGNKMFAVSTSTDLVRWKEAGWVYEWQSGWSSKYHFDSPNVFYYDGLFYLLFQSWNNDTDQSARLYYATSPSPLGPFTGRTMLHDVHEIGGHPFVDDDGRVYITLCRFDFGSNLYIEEVSVKNGVITPKPETLTMILYPNEDYEVNGRGRTCEGGVPIQHGGYYYMLYAPGSYKLHYGEAYAVSKNILGPYEKYAYNPILVYNAGLDGPGDAVVLPSPDGSELFLVYHRHNSVGVVSPRMTCIDRIKFIENPNGGPDILTVAGPSSTPQPLPSADGEAAPAEASETVVELTLGKTDARRDGETVALDVSPVSKSGRMMLPVRFVAEAFGAAVGWDASTSTATVAAGERVITVTVGKNEATVNGKALPLDCPAFIEGGRTYLPVRVIADALGAEVGWDAATATATLTKKK